MNVLALDTSAKACSVALCQDDKLLAQHFLNSGLTHSVTLMPLVEAVLSQCELTLAQIDLLAIAGGPGSFTGLRIGMSTLKGLAWAREIPCVSCSSLASMAWQLAHMEEAVVVPVMDARRDQVYTSQFLVKQGIPQRLCPDTAISIQELSEILDKIPGKKILLGDGAKLCHSRLEHCTLAPGHLLFPTAWGVAQEATRECQQSPGDLLPSYHRLSQAERERAEKMGNSGITGTSNT